MSDNYNCFSHSYIAMVTFVYFTFYKMNFPNK